jgi:hypothetical protein
MTFLIENPHDVRATRLPFVDEPLSPGLGPFRADDVDLGSVQDFLASVADTDDFDNEFHEVEKLRRSDWVPATLPS